MSKMSDTGKDHGDAVLVGCIDGILIADRSTWLDNGLDAGLGDFLDIVGKWEEGIRGKDGTIQAFLGLLNGNGAGFAYHGSHFQALVKKYFLFAYLIYKPDLQSFISFHTTTGKNEFLGFSAPDQPRKSLCPAGTRNYGETGFRKAH